MNASDDFEFEMPNRGDDRPGLDDLDDLVETEEVDDDDDDYPEDATEDDIDLVIALYREDGAPVALALELDLANDLDALITQLRRLPGDAGAVGMVSIADEVFVIVRVRGKRVQVFCSDAVAAWEWPIAHDAVEFLDADIGTADDHDEGYPVGDSDILADAGLPDFELEAMAEDYDTDTTELLALAAKKIGFAAVYAKAVATFE